MVLVIVSAHLLTIINNNPMGVYMHFDLGVCVFIYFVQILKSGIATVYVYV